MTNCVLLNARSLRNKLSELHALLKCSRPEILIVTESWLDSSVSDGVVDPTGAYTIYRHDRMSRVGGGVLALVSNHFHSYQIHVPKCFNRCELECFELVTDLSTFRIIVLYHPPDFNALGRE